MSTWPRIAMSLYVAVAVHAVILLGFGLVLPGQDARGKRHGLSLAQDHSAAVEELLGSMPREIWQPSIAHESSSGEAARQVPEQAPRIRGERSPNSAPEGDIAPPSTRLPVPSAGPDRSDSSHGIAVEEGLKRSGVASRGGGQGVETYFIRLRQHIARHGHSMPLAWRGAEVLVALDLGANGIASNLRIAASSGIADMDQEVLSWLVESQPFPKPPPEAVGPLLVPVGAGRNP